MRKTTVLEPHQKKKKKKKKVEKNPTKMKKK